jgi:hypothetical protein
MANPIWITPAGALGTIPSQVELIPRIQLEATSGEVNPSITFKILSGNLPAGLSMSSSGLISGTPDAISENTQYYFVVRITNSSNQLRDRSFYIEVTGFSGPKFIVPTGSILSTIDSVWIEKQITYTNPLKNNPVQIYLVQGILPPGLEINTAGLIRGYAEKPLVELTLPKVVTIATSSDPVNNGITCLSTIDFELYRPVVFTGTTFGGIIAGKTYYVKRILDSTTFTISITQYGDELFLTSGTGFMDVTLPDTVLGQPITRTYNFDLSLESPSGNDLRTYSITIINQNLSISKGGPGSAFLTRLPVIFNTRPEVFVIPKTDPFYPYYLLPADSDRTYPLNSSALIGEIDSDNYFSFKLIGHTFDDYNIKYQFVGLPAGLVGNEDTGWIYGTPSLNSAGVGGYTFNARVYKSTDPAIQSGLFRFALNISKDISSTVVWITSNNLGTIFNDSVSTKSVSATADVPLQYRLSYGELPPNLILLDDGQITGYVAHQPLEDRLLEVGDQTTFIFGIEAYSPTIPLIKSVKEFNITVVQEYDIPMDTVYMKATPSIRDRELINSLLTNEQIIPTEYLYRANDLNFGKSSSVIYAHQYGVYASSISQYLASIQRSFYWRNITLGTLETAIAKNEKGEIIYEVVYSKIIDDLINPAGESINFEIDWPYPINLNLGPWLTSVTNVETSYVDINDTNYVTSLTPGSALVVYPNSLPNMNKQIADTLGQQFDSRIFPEWMTSQQENGSTLGFTRAWVICYTKPGFAKIVKSNIQTQWKNQFGEVNKLNQINFTLDRVSVDKTLTYNYDNYFTPPQFTGLPSATPIPDPVDSKDFYVLFPRKTILPDQSQL